MGEKDKS